MCIGTYIAAPPVNHMTTLYVDHVGLEVSWWLRKSPERLMAHVWLWNLEVPELGVARHFAKALGDENDKISLFCLF